MFIVLLGAPGSGKGTVGKIIAEDLKLAHISTGDLFRENLKNETELGKEAKQYMDKGELVPDEVTIKMLKERLNGDDVENGAVLDGFPRTGVQAVSLDNMLKEMNAKVDMALNIDVPFDEIVERIANRRSCKGCSEIYNVVFNPPKVEGICDKCGSPLKQRADDSDPEAIKRRLEIYEEKTSPLVEYYKEKGVLRTETVSISINRMGKDVANDVVRDIKK